MLQDELGHLNMRLRLWIIIYSTYLVLPTLIADLESLLRLVAKLVLHDAIYRGLRPVRPAVGDIRGRVETAHLTETSSLSGLASLLRYLQIMVRS